MESSTTIINLIIGVIYIIILSNMFLYFYLSRKFSEIEYKNEKLDRKIEWLEKDFRNFKK